MRIEERGYSMITDKQGREWLLNKLYKNGWLYCACLASGNLYLTDKKPEKYGGLLGVYDCKKVECISGLKCILFDKLKPNEVLDIAEELGIVDWSKVKVDTPILVKQHKQDDWEKRYFASFKDGSVHAWLCGVTSWSAEHEDDVTDWRYAKLAEV